MLHSDGDASGTNKTVTVNGDPDLTTGKFDGAMSFDGAGDYLNVPDSEDWNIGSGDFTIDFWVKINNLTTDQYILNQGNDWD